uniref:Serpentine receptor class gamma n=1 Tax=Steinernema glaseri TaxID=37863 RepID=A0A1I8AUC9_9BILA
MSRMYTLWLYFVTAPSDVIQISISILQLGGLVDMSGNYYRDYCDFVQMTGKIFLDFAGIVYRVLCLLMLIATFMSYTFPFTFQKVFHQKRRNFLYLGGVIFCVANVLYNNVQTMVTIHLKPPEDLITVWRRNFLYLGGVIFCVANVLYNNVQTMVTIHLKPPEDLITARVPILTISTFVAFTPYRKALLAMIPARFKALQVTSVVVSTSPSSSASSQQFSTSKRHF